MENNAVNNVDNAADSVDKAIDDIRKALAEEDEGQVLELTEFAEPSATPEVPTPESVEAVQLSSAPDTNKSIQPDSTLAPNTEQSIQVEPANVVEFTPGVEHEVIKQMSKPANQEEEMLVSPEVADSSQKILKSYIKAVHKSTVDDINFRSGASLEDLVIELIKPELTQWLNKNLPTIVQSVVEKEIKKIMP